MNSTDISSLESRLKLIGLLMCVATPMAILIVVWVVLESMQLSSSTRSGDDWIAVWVLTGMAFAEPIIGAIVRRRLLKAETILASSRTRTGGVSQAIFAGHMVGFAFGLSPALFGLVVYLLTQNGVLATVLILVSPLAYLMFRPTEATVQELAREVEARSAQKM